MARPPSTDQVFAAGLTPRGAEPFDVLLQAHPERGREVRDLHAYCGRGLSPIHRELDGDKRRPRVELASP